MHQLLRLILIAIVATLLLVIIWGMAKGLDITDESMMLLLYASPEQYRSGATLAHFIISRATGWMEPTVVTYRWLTLSLTICSSLIFSYGFCQWLDRFFRPDPDKLVNLTTVFPFLLIAQLPLCGPGIRTLMYNHINSIILFSVAGLLFYFLSQAPSSRRFSPALFIVGVLLALDLFVKFSTAIIMLSGALLLIVLRMKRCGPRETAFAAVALMMGIIIGLAIFSVGVRGLTDWPTYFQEISEGSHKPGSILLSYAQDCKTLLIFLLQHFSIIFLSSFAIARCYALGWHRRAWWSQYVLLILLVATFFYATYKFYALDLLNSPHFNNSATFNVYALLICLEVAVLLAIPHSAPPAPNPNNVALQRNERLTGIAILTALPFAGAFGTANYIFLNALGDIAGWFALALVLGLMIEERTRSRFALPICTLLPACFGAWQIIYGTIFVPYALAAPLPNQTVALQQPASVKDLKVDPATAQFIAEVRSILDRGLYQKGDYIIALYNAPGLVYLMSGVSPGRPTYFSGQHSQNCSALQAVKASKRPVFVITTRGIDTETAICMRNAGLVFPDEFVELGRAHNSYSASPYSWPLWNWVTVFRQSTQY